MITDENSLPKLIIISGAQGTGKTTLANVISGDYRLRTNPLNLHSDLRTLSPDDKYIIIDDCDFTKARTHEKLKYILSKSFITIRRPYSRNTEQIVIPSIIIISNTPVENEFESYLSRALIFKLS